MIYLPGSGITASYTDSETGVVEAQFYQALAIYIWAWFILTVLFLGCSHTFLPYPLFGFGNFERLSLAPYLRQYGG